MNDPITTGHFLIYHGKVADKLLQLAGYYCHHFQSNWPCDGHWSRDAVLTFKLLRLSLLIGSEISHSVVYMSDNTEFD